MEKQGKHLYAWGHHVRSCTKGSALGRLGSTAPRTIYLSFLGKPDRLTLALFSLVISTGCPTPHLLVITDFLCYVRKSEVFLAFFKQNSFIATQFITQRAYGPAAFAPMLENCIAPNWNVIFSDSVFLLFLYTHYSLNKVALVLNAIQTGSHSV